MDETELRARKRAFLVPACDSGRHVYHPETCEEWELYAAAAGAWYQQAIAGLYTAFEPTPAAEVPPSLRAGLAGEMEPGLLSAVHAAVDRTITGNGTGEQLGILGWEPRELSPVERALEILGPELKTVALYMPVAEDPPAT